MQLAKVEVTRKLTPDEKEILIVKQPKEKSPVRIMIDKLNEVGAIINSRVFEREKETEGILIAILSGASCVFIGAPGAAKTMQTRIATHLTGLTVFDTLISETSKPDTIFGPTDVPALAKGTQRTKIQGYAPSAEILFFDEIFKASGIVLNPLLWLVNEHQYRNGDEGIIKCPTKAVFAASNEIPTDEALQPIYDRFLLRYQVKYLRSQENIKRMVTTDDSPLPAPLLTREEIEKLRKLVPTVEVPEEVLHSVIALRDQVQRAVGCSISDRRMSKAIKILKAKAMLHGRKMVKMSDLEILANVFWDQLDQARKVRALVMNVAHANLSDLVAYEETAEELWQKGLKTGDMDEVENRLQEMFDSVQKMKSSAGKETATRIGDYLKRVQTIKAQRNNFVIMELRNADGDRWYKLSAACESFWTPKQLRSVKFKWFRKGGYWWQPGLKKASIDAVKIHRKRIVKKVRTTLGVEPTLTKMV